MRKNIAGFMFFLLVLLASYSHATSILPEEVLNVFSAEEIEDIFGGSIKHAPAEVNLEFQTNNESLNSLFESIIQRVKFAFEYLGEKVKDFFLG